jgi:sugar/nucleoside kinase (ribokinase family)
MTAKRYDVLGIGVCAVDDLLYVPAYPPANVKVPITRKTRHAGGLACTAMAAAGHLGGRVAYVARLGNDELSEYIRKSLDAWNVDTSHILPGGEPFHSTIIIDDSGARTIFYDCSTFRIVDDIPDDLLASTRALLLDHLLDPPPIGIAQKARSLKIPIVGDIEGRSEACLPLLPLIDHLIVSEEFARWATKTEDLATACATLAQSPRPATIVTAGRAGCYLATDSQAVPQHLPAFPVNATDTNGCGDTFHGAYALALARGLSPQDAALFATAAAALKASGQGGWSSLPTAKDLHAFLTGRLPAPRPALLQCVAALALAK